MALGLPENLFLTRLDAAANWARTNSLWPMPFATACCGIELMATAASRHDLARFGAEVMRFSPRQCDLLIVAGRVVMKMLPVLQPNPLQHRSPSGACRWGRALAAEACSTRTRWSREWTGSFRSICTCRAARRGRNNC